MRRLEKYSTTPLALDKLKEPLKQTPCLNPECRRVGWLIGHGWLRGYDASGERVIRGQRVLCSNRRGRRGCGKTFPILPCDVLYRRQVAAPQLFDFFTGMLRGLSRHAAWQALGLIFSIRHAYRLWQAFVDQQLRLRALLSRLLAPPQSAAALPEMQLLEHLQAAFAAAACPIAAFQLHFQEGFLG
jgi:hypothetical protein